MLSTILDDIKAQRLVLQATSHTYTHSHDMLCCATLSSLWPHLLDPRKASMFDTKLDGVQAQQRVLQATSTLASLSTRKFKDGEGFGQGLQPDPNTGSKVLASRG